MTVGINDIEDIKQIPEQADIFWEKLQLDRKHKELILNFIVAHETESTLNGKGTKQNIDDFTTGKGKGLVILLYGKVLKSKKILIALTSYRSSGSRENTDRRELGNIAMQAISLPDCIRHEPQRSNCRGKTAKFSLSSQTLGCYSPAVRIQPMRTL